MAFFNILISILALSVLEIILGIDNLVFLSILTEKLPQDQRKKARRWGLAFAWMTRLLLLALAVWMVKLTKPFLIIANLELSVRDLFLCIGGVFLIVKATQEIHLEMTPEEKGDKNVPILSISFYGVIAQVALMDIIFSLDSVLTAIGLTQHFFIMAGAITCAIFVMIFASELVAKFIAKYPTVKMLALSFLILIGTFLMADAFHFHVPRAYIYFAMSFSLGVEALNLIRRKQRKKGKH